VTFDDLPTVCNVCDQIRPNAKTSVVRRTARVLQEAPIAGLYINVTYCNDRAACTAYANADGYWARPSRVPDDPQPPTS